MTERERERVRDSHKRPRITINHHQWPSANDSMTVIMIRNRSGKLEQFQWPNTVKNSKIKSKKKAFGLKLECFYHVLRRRVWSESIKKERDSESAKSHRVHTRWIGAQRGLTGWCPIIRTDGARGCDCAMIRGCCCCCAKSLCGCSPGWDCGRSRSVFAHRADRIRKSDGDWIDRQCNLMV